MDVNRDGLTLQDLSNLTRADVFVTGVPGIYYRLLKNDSNTRILANPQLRTSEGLAAQAKFGEEVPVPVTVVRADRGRRHQPAADHLVSTTATSASISTSRRERTMTTKCR